MKRTVDIIKKMLTERLNPSEKLHLSKTIPMDEILKQQWNADSEKHIQDKVDPNQMWQIIAAACWGTKKPKVVRRNTYLRVGYWAAAVVVVFLLGVWMAKSVPSSYIHIKASENGRLTHVLPDGSTVWLNAGSEMKYAEHFATNRTLQLKGEAFFNVIKMHGQTFKVFFNESCVEVKGTEFNIHTDAEGAEITLFSGKVVFSSEGLKQKFEMSPSECIVYKEASHQVERSKIDLQEYDWRDDEYRFQNKPLGELINFMNRIYKVNIVMEDADCKYSLFTGTIRKTESLSDVLNKICISFELHQMNDGDNIILY